MSETSSYGYRWKELAKGMNLPGLTKPG